MDDAFRIRSATLADVEHLVAHRRAMFFEMGHRDEDTLAAMSAAFRPWVASKMESGEYLAWTAVSPAAEVVGGAGLWLMDWPPHMIGPGSRRGNILHVYTDPAWRRRGIARNLMEASLAWCREHGIRAVILHASAEGR